MQPSFRAGSVRAQVPATSANIGPGFDALGLALDLVDDLQACVTESGLQIDVTGEGEALPRDENHLVVRAMRAAFDRLGGQPRGLRLGCANRIPHGRGLGSSAAAIVGGILLARALVVDGDRALPDPAALALASELEGHPDNVAPALLGGFTIAWQDDAGARAVRLDCDPGLRPVVLIPPFEASTEQARGLLPATVPHADAAANAGRAALLVAALSGAPEHLFAATEDRLHQQYRAPAMPASAALVQALRSAGLPAVISGAGPTVLVLAANESEIQRVVSATPQGWRALPLPVRAGGAVAVPAGSGAAGNTPGALDVAASEPTV
jgi:homoserine kinase